MANEWSADARRGYNERLLRLGDSLEGCRTTDEVYQTLKAHTVCAHETNLVSLTCSDGRVQFKRLCRLCGNRAGPIAFSRLSEKERLEARPIEAVDQPAGRLPHDLFRKAAHALAAARNDRICQAKRDSELREFRAELERRLNSPDWPILRQIRFDQCGGVCQGCGIRPATELHHMTYDHLGEEFLWELMPVCRTCHGRYHGHITINYAQQYYDWASRQREDRP